LEGWLCDGITNQKSKGAQAPIQQSRTNQKPKTQNRQTDVEGKRLSKDEMATHEQHAE